MSNQWSARHQINIIPKSLGKHSWAEIKAHPNESEKNLTCCSLPDFLLFLFVLIQSGKIAISAVSLVCHSHSLELDHFQCMFGQFMRQGNLPKKKYWNSSINIDMMPRKKFTSFTHARIHQRRGDGWF
jgi:hypothetical protein